jgi:hypothetical protein
MFERRRSEAEYRAERAPCQPPQEKEKGRE